MTINLILQMELPASLVEMPEGPGLPATLHLSPSTLLATSLLLPSGLALVSLGPALARVATLGLDCALVTAPGQRREVAVAGTAALRVAVAGLGVLVAGVLASLLLVVVVAAVAGVLG